MKFTISPLYLSLFLLIVAMGCKDDQKEESADLNSFTYDGKSYNTPKAFLLDYGSNDEDSYDYDLLFTSSGIRYNSSSEEYSGEGDIVYLDLNSPLQNELAPSTYTFDAEYNSEDFATRQPNTFVHAGIILDLSVSNRIGAWYETNETSTGSVSIERAEFVYKVTYTFKLPNGKTVEGYFEGTLEPISEKVIANKRLNLEGQKVRF